MRRLQYPILYIDLNDRLDDRHYWLCTGSYTSFEKLGISPEDSVGHRFTFWMDEGTPNDIMFEGILIRDPEWKFLAEADLSIGYFERRDVELDTGAQT